MGKRAIRDFFPSPQPLVPSPLAGDSRTRIVTDEDKFLRQFFAVDCDFDLLELTNDAAKKSLPPG